MHTYLTRIPLHVRAILAGLALLAGLPMQLEQFGLPAHVAELVGAAVFLVGYVVDRVLARRAAEAPPHATAASVGLVVSLVNCVMLAGCGGAFVESLRLDPMVQPMYARAEVTPEDGGHIEGAVRVFGIPIVTRADIAPGGDASICWYVEGFRKPLGCIASDEAAE